MPEILRARAGRRGDPRLGAPAAPPARRPTRSRSCCTSSSRRRGGRSTCAIFATDVHRTSLDVACGRRLRRGRAVGASRPSGATRYFVRDGDRYRVSQELRQMIVFAQHNLINDAPFTRSISITCRNLLIYFQPLVQQKVLSLFHFGLKTGGTLFLGPSETPGESRDEFETIDEHWRIYRKRRDARLPDIRLPARHATPSGAARAAARSGGATWPGPQLLATLRPAARARSCRRACSSTSSYQLVHTFGGAETLLRVKRAARARRNVLDLRRRRAARPRSLGALQHANKERRTVRLGGVPRVDDDGGAEEYRLTVEPFGAAAHGVDALSRAVREQGADGADREATEAARRRAAGVARLRVRARDRAALHQGEPAGDDRGARDRRTRSCRRPTRSSSPRTRSCRARTRSCTRSTRSSTRSTSSTSARSPSSPSSPTTSTTCSHSHRRRRPVPRRRAVHPQVHVADRERVPPPAAGRRAPLRQLRARPSSTPGSRTTSSRCCEDGAADRARGDRAASGAHLPPAHPALSLERAASAASSSRSSTSARSSAARRDVRRLSGDRRVVDRRDHASADLGRHDHELEPRRRAALRLRRRRGDGARRVAPHRPDEQRSEFASTVAARPARRRGRAVRDDDACARTAAPSTCSSALSPLRDEHGQLVGTSSIARDITQRQRDEAGHRARAARCASSSWRCSRTSCATRWRRCCTPRRSALGRRRHRRRRHRRPRARGDRAAVQAHGAPARRSPRRVAHAPGRHRAAPRACSTCARPRRGRRADAAAGAAGGRAARGRAARRAGARVRRSRSPAADRGQPARQRHQVHAARQVGQGVAVGAATAHAILRVRDDGIGIPRDMLEQIFEPFVRAVDDDDRDGTLHNGGMGLGLALVRSFVRRARRRGRRPTATGRGAAASSW